MRRSRDAPRPSLPAEQAEARLSTPPVSRGHILIVDGEAHARSSLAELLRKERYQVETAADGFKALAKIEEVAPELLLTELSMPGLDGLALMHKARALDPDLETVMMAADGAVSTAVAAMRQGAADYLGKPLDLDQLTLVLDRVLERRRLRLEAGQLRQHLSAQRRLSNMVGSSAQMQQVFEKVLQVAPSRASVMITGESGTGKELIAAAIHEHSARSAGPFVKLHCAALAETLLESELFGHEKGAFTGAATRRNGRLQQADGGTLFLDEIGEISPSVQVKLLRFLQEREIERVGSNETIKLNVRIVAATNHDLEQQVRDGEFREDLYYRLHVVTIHLPPLRERPSDIPLLAAHFLRMFSAENGKSIVGFADDALCALAHHAWHGNVRELENAIERAVVVCRGDEIRARDLGLVSDDRAPGVPVVPGASMAELERYAILTTLEHTRGSTSRAAEILGISPRKIQYRLHEYGRSVLVRPHLEPS